MSVSFSQDGVGTVKTPKRIPSDATAASRIMGEQRTYGDIPIPPDAYQNAMKEWAAISTGQPVTSLGAPKAKTLASSVTGLVWKPIGPSGITAGTSIWNGRIDSIAVNPNNPSVIYSGATDGGVWKSIDAGVTWTPLTDHEPMLAIGEPGAIAIDPNNTDILYVGTSSFLKVGNQGLQLNTTIGILKSTDGGNGWIVLGSGFPAGNTGNANQFVNQKHLCHRRRSCQQCQPVSCGEQAVCISRLTPGRTGHWEPAVAAVQADSLAFDASSPVGNRTLFAGVNGVGIKRSIDGGNNWSQVLNSLTPAVAAQLTAHSTITSNRNYRQYRDFSSRRRRLSPIRPVKCR